MAYAHSRGVIHRDLKPANIMVGAFGEVQVMDWGLAKVLPAGGVADEKKSQVQQGQSIIQTMRSIAGSDTPGTFGTLGSQTQMGSVMGTPAYMPPEQALGEIDQMDERADVFGLGAILCEILTGKPPYVADDGTQVYRMASRGKLEDAFTRLDDCGADADLIAVTKGCLKLEPVDRPRNAGVLAGCVTEYLESVETKLRETEMERATQAARADAEALQAEAESRRAEVETQRAQLQLQAAKRLRVIVASLALIAVLCGITAVQFQRSSQQQRQMAQKQNEDRAQALVESLLSAELVRVPSILEQMESERELVDPLLAASRREHAEDHQAQRRIALALRAPEQDVDTLLEWLLVAEMDELATVRDILSSRAQAVSPPLWSVALDAQQSDEKRLRAAASLALFDPTHVDWQQMGPYSADQILSQPLLLLDKWADLLRPVRSSLLANLAAAFRNPAADQRLRRDKATVLLAKQFDDEPDVLVDLLLDADVEQFESVLTPIQRHRDSAVSLLQVALEQNIARTKNTDEFVHLASRQANAAVGLARLGATQHVWQVLRQSPRPDARSFLIHRLGTCGVDPKLIVDQLSVEADVSIRRALIQSLGEFPLKKTDTLRTEVTRSLLKSYSTDPDPGIHGSAGWLLRHWGHEPEARKIDAEPNSHEIVDGRQWYVDAGGRTMVILPPTTFPMGQPGADGAVHQRVIDRAFAISNVVIKGGNWVDMARYCIELSRAEGIPEDQWCYRDRKREKTGDGEPVLCELAPDYLRRTGYRMPTESEWEYACRAGTVGSRYFGEAETLIDHYAWYRGNSPVNTTHPVALLKPNQFGLFDMLGNQRNTCVGRINDNRNPHGLSLWDVEMSNLEVAHAGGQPSRGLSYNEMAARAYDRQRQDEIFRGAGEHALRVVRTLPLEMCRKAFGDAHPATLGALYNEAILALGRKDDERADELDQQLMNYATTAAGKDPELWQAAMRFATRLAARRDQQNHARERCDKLLADPSLVLVNDLCLAELRLKLELEDDTPTWQILHPVATENDPEKPLTPLEDGSLALKPGQHNFPLPEVGDSTRAIRIETSPETAPSEGTPPPFTEYSILSTELPDQGFRGRYIRLDLPGDSSQFPRIASDEKRKFINLAELEVLQDQQNIALRKAARSSSGSDRAEFAAANGVDGNLNGDTVGNNITENPYVHTWDAEPWFEVDLGSEQTFDRIVIWNRSGASYYDRMNHLRVRILAADYSVLFERVIDKAPNPSLEIKRQIELVTTDTAAADNGTTRQLSFDSRQSADPWQRIRISSTQVAPSLIYENSVAEGLGEVEIEKLINLYLRVGNEAAIDKLLAQHPQFAITLADRFVASKHWDLVISIYNRIITPETTDVGLLSKRAAAYAATEQWNLAKADWLRLMNQQPELLMEESDMLIERVVDFLQTNHPDRYLSVLPILANAAAERGQVERARGFYHQLITLQPENRIWNERIESLGPGVLAAWNFDHGHGEWQPNNRCKLSVKSGSLTVSTTGDNPNFSTKVQGPAGSKEILMRYRSDEDFILRVFWPDEKGVFSVERSYDYKVPASPEVWRDVTLPFSSQEALNSIRLDPNTAPENPLEIDRLVLRTREPSEAVIQGDLHAAANRWEQAIAEYSKDILEETTDVELLSKRASCYVAAEQWGMAETDWLRVVEFQPSQLRAAFNTFRKAGRHREAVGFGQRLFEIHPEQRDLWLELAPLLVLVKDDEAYRSFCNRVLARNGLSADATLAVYATRACLLRPDMVDVTAVPVDVWVKPLEDSESQDNTTGLRWGLRGLLALRSGKPELVTEYIGKSEKLVKWPPNRASNYSVLALAEHELQHPDEARAALAEAAKLIISLNKAPDYKSSYAIQMAEILFHEAEAKINGE